VRGSWTDGHNQNLILREHKDKSHICSGGVEGFTGPEEKGEGDGIGIGIKNRGE